MNEQKEILKTTLNTWKGDLEQVDDVCLIALGSKLIIHKKIFIPLFILLFFGSFCFAQSINSSKTTTKKESKIQIV